jgi:glutathione S-transferase
MALTLIIGNKNYSSWSMRPWIALKVARISFEEEVISLDAKDFKERIGRVSGAGKVPVLVDGDMAIWDSLAILEYLADKFPQAALWPADLKVRARARSISAEMHSGFPALRRHCPMNMWRPAKKRELTPEVIAEVRRIDAIWTECRTAFGTGGGPFLFGAFGAADAMYAPIVARFQTYDIEVGRVARAYMQAIMALPPFVEWRAAAVREPWVLSHNEVDWPTVLRR